MKQWVQTENGIECDGVEIFCESPNSFPLFITEHFGVLCGDNGNYHSSVTGNDREKIALLKAFRLLRKNDESIRDVDLSGCDSNLEKANRIASFIIKDAYQTGRCYDLTNKYGQVVFTFWSQDFDTDKVIDEVCEEKELDRSLAYVAKPEISLSTPDEMIYNGRYYSYVSKFATPFTVLLNPKTKKIAIRLGKSGERHDDGLRRSITADLERAGYDASYYDKLLIVEGRFWRIPEDDGEVVIFSFWTFKRQIDEKKIMQYISAKCGFSMEDTYYTNLDKFLSANTDEPLKTNEQDLLDKMHAIHLMNQKDKREALADFRAVKDKKWDDEHRREDGSVPTRAEYNASIPFRE